eukprot:scaffold573_cov24-Attheya_sp.AAC.1
MADASRDSRVSDCAIVESIHVWDNWLTRRNKLSNRAGPAFTGAYVSMVCKDETASHDVFCFNGSSGGWGLHTQHAMAHAAALGSPDL